MLIMVFSGKPLQHMLNLKSAADRGTDTDYFVTGKGRKSRKIIFYFFLIFAQASRSVTVRLNTSFLGREFLESGQK